MTSRPFFSSSPQAVGIWRTGTVRAARLWSSLAASIHSIATTKPDTLGYSTNQNIYSIYSDQ
jgi:hypothetical protein